MRNRRGIAGGVRHSHHAAIARPNTDDWPESEILAQRLHVLDVLVEVIFIRITARRTTVAAMVKIHKLHSFCEPRVSCLSRRVIYARTTMYKKGRGPFVHARAVYSKRSTIYIKVDFGITNSS